MASDAGPSARTAAVDAAAAPTCCSAFYEQEWVRVLADDSFHPGGEALSRRTFEAMRLPDGASLLDIGCGSGTTALMLSREYGAQVSGVDPGAENTERARRKALSADVTASFRRGGSCDLPFPDNSQDGVLCECSFSLFPAKPRALQEIRRVLVPGGRFAMTDMAVGGTLPEDLAAVLAPWTCLADACSPPAYAGLIESAGFEIDSVTDESACLSALVSRLKRKLLLLGAGAAVSGQAVPGVDIGTVRHWLGRFQAAAENGAIRYCRIHARSRI